MKPVYVVSAPSGTGKTTLNQRLVTEHPNLVVAVSYTTREPRPDEISGHHYHYISEAEFQKKIEGGMMLEWASVHGNLYGTGKDELERLDELDLIPILEIDVQGWEQAKPKIMRATSVFIMPPSLEDLWLRLKSRGTDMKKSGLTRFLNAKREIESAHLYDHFLINHDIEESYRELERILVYGKLPVLQREDGLKHAGKLINEFRFKDKIIARYKDDTP